MQCRHFVLIVGVVLGLSLSAWAKADEKDPQSVLADKGLRRVDQYFVIAEESQIGKKLHDAEGRQKKVLEAEKKATAAEKKVDDNKTLMRSYAKQRHDLRTQLEQTKNPQAQARIINALNEMGDRMSAIASSTEEETAAEKARTNAATVSEEYIESLLKLRKQYQGIKEQYTKLGADPEVIKAIEDYNKAENKKCKLGPTGAYAANGKRLAKLVGNMLSDSIALHKGGGDLYHVTVMLNGTHATDMSIDTGATIISLPYKVAEAAGLTPTSQSPSMKVKLADGHLVDAKLVIAASVRVGQFEVKDVECGVMPADLPDAEALLGLSYLKHFTYKIDTAKSKLVISKVEKGSGASAVAGGRLATDDSPAQTEQPKDATQAKAQTEKAEKLAKLLKPDGPAAPGEEAFSVKIGEGAELNFEPAKHGPVDSLQKTFGTPDEIHKVAGNFESDGSGKDKVQHWQVWTWGTVHVLVDEDGKTRYVAVSGGASGSAGSSGE
jgi:aspartyl protease family protein